jgi:hypothetical protein
MIKYNQVKLFLRKTYNRLVGKKILIDEYNNITHSICCHTDDMPECALKDKIIAEFNELNEYRWNRSSRGEFYISNYNPYRSSNFKLGRKISQGLDIITKYGIRLRD